MHKLNTIVPDVLYDHGASERNRIGLERLIFFSDAVFAIAITLLALDIRLPAGAEMANDGQLFRMLTGLWPKYFAYILSFWVIGLYWISHHRKFLFIERFDTRLLRLNLALLMVIAFIPFPTAVMSANGGRTATIFYALVMILGGLLVTALWWYVVHNHYIGALEHNRKFLWQEVTTPLATAGIFLLSIGLAFWNDGWARFCWIMLLPLTLFLNARRAGA